MTSVLVILYRLMNFCPNAVFNDNRLRALKRQVKKIKPKKNRKAPLRFEILSLHSKSEIDSIAMAREEVVKNINGAMG